jgi:acetyl esterase/lipase
VPGRRRWCGGCSAEAAARTRFVARHWLPPATIVNAESGPLRSDGEALARRLREAGVPAEQRTYQGVTHEFFVMAPVVADATAAQGYVAQRLRSAFAGGRATTASR